MRYNRKKTLLAIFGLLFLAVTSTLFMNKINQTTKTSIYDGVLEPAPIVDEPMTGINDQWEIDETFETHLPIIVIDSSNKRPPINMEQDEEGIFWPIPGVEPYRDGFIKIINTGDLNRINDTPESESLIQIRRRGNSSMNFEKAQYLVKLVTESGQERYEDFLGMGEEREWVINGSSLDKSMMRNYLAFRLGNDILPYTPESAFCEVVYHENGRYYYEGVHLLMENIRQGEERISIEPAGSSDPFPSYIVRRDRIGEDENIMDTWATREGLSFNYLGLIYPSRKNATQKDIDYVTEDLSKIEKVLYSEDPNVFATYRRHIDVASFIDYFLINEFLGNYDAGNNSTYMYKEKGGKLKMGPIWDYDGAMDNYRYDTLDYDVTAFQMQPWFDRLMKDKHFIDQMQKRYAELRRGVFSDENFLSTVDMVTNHLGSAVDREWTRWNHLYTQENRWGLKNFGEQNELVRNAVEHRVEMYRLKTGILRHGDAIGPYLKVLQKSTSADTSVNHYMPLFLLVAVLGFALPAFYVSRK